MLKKINIFIPLKKKKEFLKYNKNFNLIFENL